MNKKVINLDTEIKNVVKDDFHVYRMKFSTAFLAENYEQSLLLTEQAIRDTHLKDSQLIEIARNYLLLGHPDKATHSLDRVLSVNPNHQEAIQEKLKIFKNTGKTDEYIELLQNCISAQVSNAKFYQLLFDCYVQTGMLDKSRELETQAHLNGIELKHSYMQNIHDSDVKPQNEIAFENPLFIERFLNLFQGRENSHARQWVSANGKSGYNPIQEPLTHAKIRGHLMGLYTLGAYQLNMQNRVKWIVFDIDITKEHLADIHDPQFDAWIQEGFFSILTNIKKVLDSYQIEALYEFSGYKGYHVWIFFQSEVNATLAKSIAQRLASEFELGAYPINLEVFPKQSRVSKNSYGNLVKLPGGIHKVTGLRSYFVSLEKDQLQAIQIFDAISLVKQIDAKAVMQIVHTIQPSIADLTKETDASPQDNTIPEIVDKYDDALASPKWVYLKEQCFALRNIVAELETKTFLDAKQKKIITYTIGTFSKGKDMANALLKKSSNWQSSDFLKSALKGNAMSCNKIRKLLNITPDNDLCSCDFSDLHPAYNSPILHLERYDQSRALPAQNQKSKLRETVSAYLDIKQKHQKYEIELKNLETQIYLYFDEIGVSEFDTGFGILKLSNKEDIKTLSLIL
jgi:hypothetical protein